jgi:hypothetical protein
MTKRTFPSRRLRRLLTVGYRRELRIWIARTAYSYETAYSIDLGIESAPYGGEKLGVGETKIIRVCCPKPFSVRTIMVPPKCALSFEIIGLSVADQSFVTPGESVPCEHFSPVSNFEFSQALPDLDSRTEMALTVRNIGYEPMRFYAALRGERLGKVRRRKGKLHAWQLKIIKARIKRIADKYKKRFGKRVKMIPDVAPVCHICYGETIAWAVSESTQYACVKRLPTVGPSLLRHTLSKRSSANKRYFSRTFGRWFWSLAPVNHSHT